MPSEKTFPLALIIRAVDKASAPLRAMQKRLNALQDDKDGKKKLARLGAAWDGLTGKVGRYAKMLAGLAGGALAGGLGVFALVKGAVDAGDKLGEMAQRVGLGVDAYASLQHAAAQADVGQEQFNASMDKFNVGLGQARAGTGSLLKFLNRVSPTLAKQVTSAKSTEEALGFMTDAFEKVKDPNKRAALAAAVFGKANSQMGVFLGQGSDAIKEQVAAFQRLAGPQGQFAERAGILDNSMRELEIAFLGTRNAMATALFPAFNKLAILVTDFLVKNREGLVTWAKKTGGAILAWVNGGGFDRLVDWLQRTGNTVVSVVSALGGLKGIAVIAGAYMAGSLLVSIAQVAIAINGLGIGVGAAMLALAPFVIAAGALALAGYQIWKNWEPLKEFFNDLFDAPLKKLRENLAQMREEIGSVLAWTNPIGITGKLVGGVSDMLGGGAPKPTTSRSEARVSVDFNNAPAGTRVKQDKSNTAPVDLSMGFAMGGAM